MLKCQDLKYVLRHTISTLELLHFPLCYIGMVLTPDGFVGGGGHVAFRSGNVITVDLVVHSDDEVLRLDFRRGFEKWTS